MTDLLATAARWSSGCATSFPDTQLQQRARRQLGYVALTATLMRHARDERDEPLFLVKGGVAIELLLGLRARATKDLDATARLAAMTSHHDCEQHWLTVGRDSPSGWPG
jgi:hypothetical protein